MIKNALVLAMACIAGNAQVFTIDDFEAAPFSQTGSSTEFATYEDESILGGFRQVRMAHQNFELPNVNTTVADGVLTFNETAPSVLVMRYGSYADANDATALGLNLTQTDYAFTIDVISMTSHFNGSIGLYSYDEGGTGHYYDGIFFDIMEPGTHSFSLADLGTAPNMLDTSNIAGFQIVLGSGFGETTGIYEFGEIAITPVPEPSTYAAIFAVGLLGLAGWKRLTSHPIQTRLHHLP